MTTVAEAERVELERPAQRWPLLAVLVLGLGLVAAPAIFQMFDRAPGGGEMLVDFEPYMQVEKIDGFRADLTQIGAAHTEATAAIAALPPDQQGQFPSVAAFDAAWPALDADMRSMLDDMERNIGRYRGVNALPPFAVFPWFFVLPGLIAAGLAGWTLLVDAGRRPTRGRWVALVCLGVGLVAAPVVFQMFTRAPGGAAMIDDFRPFMTPAKVSQVQGYFLTIGGAESELRRAVVPAVAASSGASPDAVLPAVQALNRDWPSIAAEMAPMVGTMADNVDNFSGIAALPPFWLFPWFFVIPGVAIGVLAWRAREIVITPVERTGRFARVMRTVRGVPLSRRDVGRAVAGVTAIVVVVALAVATIQSGAKRTSSTTSRSAPTVERAPVAAPAVAPAIEARPGPAPAPAAAPVPVVAALPRETAPAPQPPAPGPAPEPSPRPTAPEPAPSCSTPLPEGDFFEQLVALLAALADATGVGCAAPVESAVIAQL